jgi:hypothetical protein
MQPKNSVNGRVDWVTELGNVAMYLFFGGLAIEVMVLTERLPALLATLVALFFWFVAFWWALDLRNQPQVMLAGRARRAGEPTTGLAAAIALVPVLALMFGIVCQRWQDYEPVFETPPDASTWTWLGFGADNLLEAILFDAPSVYGLQIAGIHPRSRLAQTAVVAYRAVLDLVLIRAVVVNWSVVRRAAGPLLATLSKARQ